MPRRKFYIDLLNGILLITSIHLLAAASPGPDFVLVLQQTLTNGKKSGFLVSIGIALELSNTHSIPMALQDAAFSVKCHGYMLVFNRGCLLSRPSISDKSQRLGHWINRVLGAAMILMD